jgi:phosphoketolase
MACCGDTPTLEILAAVSILREYLPELKIRVINVVDLMKLQSANEHPHGLSETDYDSLFTKDKRIEHKHYIDQHSQDLPEIRNWKWSQSETQKEKRLAEKDGTAGATMNSNSL